MSALQIFLLGMMVAWTPSLLLLAVVIFGARQKKYEGDASRHSGQNDVMLTR
jgi:hypothetical protein